MISKKKVLLLEDTISISMVYEGWLKREGIETTVVANGSDALKQLRSMEFAVCLLDLQLPDMNGIDILKAIRKEQIPTTIVVVTSTGSLTTAVDVMKAGAYDYLVKPPSQDRLITTVRNAMEREALQNIVREIAKPYSKPNLSGFVGSSLEMVAVYRMIEAVGRSNANVFVTGESGTGKEICAQAVHQSSARKDNPFIALNCAALPKDLIESEIFGHLKGAFTGATADRTGAAIAANGGTLFLDEICEMDLPLQAKLLRFLQTGTVQRVGSDKVEKVDVRIVCATNRDPVVEVEENRFREDLFYRLHVVPIHLPPLRDREGDVIEIANMLLENINAEERKGFSQLSHEAENALLAHSWPGNVRELQNVIRNAIVLNEGEVLEAEMLSIAGPQRTPQSRKTRAAGSAEPVLGSDITLSLGTTYDAMERQFVEATIAHCGGSIPKAAEILDVSPSTIYRKKESWQEDCETT